ncbi:MAG: DNA gyrase subunit A [Alphaproteobacteria bacterium]|nr:DNA gyrase subunit A [Alphaproteobacteria bacterium]
MRRSYLDYAMSVIVARALPDVRDGLKPVHRRILYSMQMNGNLWNRAYRKSARITGDVMGKYHPHGNLAIYDAMVRLAQTFSMRLPLIDGQGNFGSDSDPPAAERYTEARLARVAESLLDDLDKDTVDFQPNYDDTEQEPKVLPAGFPNLLVNGAQGIAVGMATNIPPHNLGEVIDACCAYLDNRGITVEELMEHVPAPDFPTGGIIVGRNGSHAGYKTGRGAVVLRAKHHIEEIGNREALVFTQMPYQVNGETLQKRIAECHREKLVEGIAENGLRDETDKDGTRLVIELKRDADPDIVLNQLYRHTSLQTSFGVNMLALNEGRPELMTLRDVIVAFIRFREEVVTRRTTFLLNKARERAHILVGLLVAVANIDEIIALIRAAPDPATARDGLLGRRWPTGEVGALLERVGEETAIDADGTYQLSDAQARAILDLRLQRLTGLERDKIAEELQELIAEIARHLEILRSPEKLIEVLRAELIAIKTQFATPRRTAIEDVEFEADVEALIQREDMVVTVSHAGYIKRVPLSTYRAQRRGGRGRAGMAIREEDFLNEVFVASTLDPVLFFTSTGRVYKLKVYRLPLGTPQARGRPMVNLLPLGEGETISTVMPLPEDEDSWSALTVMFATAAGYVRRNALSDFVDVRANGKIAMKFEGEDADDRLIAVAPCSEANDVLLATRDGKAIRFPVGEVRVFAGRSSVGVRGIRLLGDDQVISMSILRHEQVSSEIRDAYLKLSNERRRQSGEEPEPNGQVADDADAAETQAADAAISEEVFADLATREEFVLSVTEKGFGVRSSAYGYRITGRGGQGITNMNLSLRRDSLVAVFPVGASDQIMLVTDGGMVIRTPVHDIRIARRGSAGVVIFRVGEGERVVSVARLPEVAEDDGDGAGEPESEEGEGK